jgi:hypothetical protein
MTASEIRIPVTMRALIQRINRKLVQNDKRRWPQKVYLSRGRSSQYGYCRLRINRNLVLDSNINPKALATRLRVLKRFEESAP